MRRYFLILIVSLLISKIPIMAHGRKWTLKDKKILFLCIIRHKSSIKGFRRAAMVLGRTEATCKQIYYTTMKKVV